MRIIFLSWILSSAIIYAAEQSIPQAALDRLAEQVQLMVDQQEIVGGELHIIHNGNTVLRQAFGWKDREADIPMQTNAVYCVRSMTKPLVGTAIQLLIEEGRLNLDTPLHQILPIFEQGPKKEITIQHLLTHSAGFPFTTMNRAMQEYPYLQAVAQEAAQTKLLFQPGSSFQYSDAGSDILGAVVAKLTGAPVEIFIQQSLLDPLGMKETWPLITESMRQRIPAAYSGGTGAWSKHWSPDAPPIFSVFLPSQSLYSTTSDYARFLTMWMDLGMAQGKRIMSETHVNQALKPQNRLEGYPAVFDGLQAWYGQHWITYASPDHESIAFGHDGSDGTYAWVWPKRDLIVLFFTQSRGTLAGISLAADVQKYLINGEIENQADTQEPTNSEQIAGMYWDETAINAYYVVSPVDERIRIERPGRMREVFKPTDTAWKYVHEARSDVWVEFIQDSQGQFTTMRTSFGGNVEHNPRHVPSDDLPSITDIITKVQQAHGIKALEEIGVIRMNGMLNFKDRGMKGPVTMWFDHERERVELNMGSTRTTLVKNGAEAWERSPINGSNQLEGARLEEALLDRMSVRFGDWTQHYQKLEVLKRLPARGRTLLLIRAEPKQAPGQTIYVDEQSGMVWRVDSFSTIPGMGVIGVETTYGDFQDVEGMQIPFRTGSKYATKLLGRVEFTVNKVKTEVKDKPKRFSALTASR